MGHESNGTAISPLLEGLYDGATPLMFAANGANRPLYELLLRYGASKLMVDRNGETALEYDDKLRFFTPAERDAYVRLLKEAEEAVQS